MTQSPKSLGELFWVFNRMALQGFGGVLAVARFELVDRVQWLSADEFVEMLSISQVMPGPNVVNLALMFGHRHFGTRGAVVALAGMLAIPALIVLGMAAAYGSVATHPMAVAALRGMGAVSAGLVLATALKSLPAIWRNALGHWVAALLVLATILWIVVLKWPLYVLVPVLGGLGMTLAWRNLRLLGRGSKP